MCQGHLQPCRGGRDRHHSLMGPSFSAAAAAWLLKYPVPLQTVKSSKKGSNCPPRCSRWGVCQDLAGEGILIRNKPLIFLTVQTILGQRLFSPYLTSLLWFSSHPKDLPFKTTFSYTHFNRYLNAFCEHYPVKQTPIISFPFPCL